MKYLKYFESKLYKLLSSTEFGDIEKDDMFDRDADSHISSSVKIIQKHFGDKIKKIEYYDKEKGSTIPPSFVVTFNHESTVLVPHAHLRFVKYIHLAFYEDDYILLCLVINYKGVTNAYYYKIDSRQGLLQFVRDCI